MYVEITETYSFVREGTVPALVTEGCGCCSSYVVATPKRIDEAIEETERFLADLRALRARVAESNAG